MQHENAGEPGDAFSRLFPNHSAEEHHPGGHAIDACQTSGVSPPKLAAIKPIVDRVRRTDYWMKASDGPKHWRKPLTDALLTNHASGECVAVGACPIERGYSTTRLALLDLDSHKGESSWPEMSAAARRLIEAGAMAAIVFVPFRSTGGRGIHLYAIWDEEQDARSVRTALADLLTTCGFTDGTRGVKAGEAEIFPKQDSVPADGWGNMFILPGAGESVPLDPVSLDEIAWKDVVWSTSDPVPFVEPPKPRELAVSAGPQQYEKVRSALFSIDPNTLDYDGWLRMVFATHASTEASDEGLALMHEWSAQFARYTPEETDKQWNAAKIKPGGIGWGTLRHAAWNAAKWVDPDDAPDASGFDGFAAAPVDVKAEVERLSGVFDGGKQTDADVRAFLALPGESQTQILDTLDVMGDDGARATAEAAIERARERAQAEGQVRPARFTAIPAAEFANRPSIRWRIKGVLPAAGVVMIYGQPASGKSFFALDICAAIARGESWRGHKVATGSVLYVAAEGRGGFSVRLRAYMKEHGLDAVPGLWVVGETPNFYGAESDAAALAEVATRVGAAVVVIDTLAASSAGADENTAKDMGAVMGRLNAIQAATGGLVVLVHHSGKDESKGARGWSGMKAAVDTEIEVSRPDEEQPGRVARVSKQKDGEAGQAFGFELVAVELGTDLEGDSVTSCVVKPIDEVPVKQPKSRARDLKERRPSGQYKQAAYDHAVAAGGPVHLDELLDVIVARMRPPEDGRRDLRRSNARREIDGLIEKDFLEVAPGGCLRLRGTGEGL